MNTSDEKLNIDPKKLKSYKLKANAGFTLLELMVIMGITATIGSVSYLSISGFMARNTLELTAQELLAHLRDARQRAVSQDQSSQWGVHLKADASDIDYYEIFYGASYAGGTIVQKIVLPPAIQFLTPAQGASDDIIFMKATGKVNVSHVIVLALVNDTSVTRAINISTGNSAIEFLSTAPSFNFSLNVSPNSGTVSSGNSTAAGVDVSLLTGASQLTDFSASGLPAGVTASFSPVSCNPSCTAVMTINTLISTPPGSSAITIASTDGITTRTAIYTLTVNASPNAPRDLTATGGTGQIILNWQAPSSDGGSAITNYKIYRGTTSGGETLLTTVGNVLTYSDTSVSGGTTYYYKVSAVNGIGEGVQSNEANSIPNASVPTAPQNLTANEGTGLINLFWQAPSSDGGSAITNYKIYRGTTSGGETLLTTVGNVLTYSDTSVIGGTTYYYKVSAVNVVGESGLGNEVNVAATGVSSAPQSLVITALNSRTKLVWQAPASNGGSAITGYKIYRGTSSGGETLLTTLGNVFLYLDKSNLNNGTTYYYKVTAINGVGDSSYSNEVSGSPINSYSVFISSATYNGNLGGLSGADVKCQSLANTQSIGGSWKAWLSSSVTSASSRLYHPAVPYKLLTGTTVVNNWTDLTDGTIASPINKTESGNTNGGSTWTNTNSNGTVYSSNTSLTCQDWTSSLGYPSVPLSYVVRYGSGGATNSGWTAYNSAGCNNNLNLYCFEQPVVSDAPQNLLATATTSVTVYLTWQAPFNGTSAITNYKIYRGTSSGGESLIATIGNLLVYNDTSLTIGPAYYYKVTAVNAIGESVFSNESSATPYAGISLAPTITKAVAANARVPIYWSTPSSDGGSAITSYKIYRGTSSGGETLLYTVGNLLNYLDYNSIINGITYYYKISAVNNIGESALSNEINVTPNNLALVFITSSTYSANLGGVAGADSICQVKADSVSLGGSWKAWLSDSNTSAASRFYHSPVFYKTVNGSTIANNWSDLTDGSISSYLYVTEMGANASSFAAWTNTTFGGSALGNSCINWTSISSSNSGGYGFASNLNSGWTQSSISTCNTTSRLYCFEQSGPPSAPPNLNVIPGIGQAILDWQAPSSDGGSPITNYKIYRGTSSGGETLLTTLGNVLTYTDNSLGIGTYYYKVSAVNSIGEGVLSNEARTSMDFSLSSSPPSNSLVQGSFVTTTVTITKIDGPAVSVSLSASGLPAGVTASFNPTSCTPNNTCTSTLTLNVSAPAPVGTYPITINGTDGYSTKSTTHTLTILLQASVSYKRVFLTSSKFNGNLGGLSGADSQCQTIASGIGLGGSWKAWLSSGSISASSRLTHASAPYKLLTGSTVANNWTDLTDASLSTAISVDETGKNHPSNELLDSWTNASTNGGIKSSSIYDHCSNWTVGTNQLGGIYIYGYLGYVNGTDYAWTDWLNSNDVCSIPHNLYCFEQ